MSNLTLENEVSDKELIRHFVATDDENAFKALVTRYQRQLYDFVWRHIGHHEDAADICQKVFVQVLTKVKQYRGEASFKTWLYQVAINQCHNHYRTRKRRPEVMLAPTDMALHIEDTASEPTDCAAEQQRLHLLMQQLPDKQRQTLYLHIYQDCSFQEVATILGCPVGTAKANYHHAIQNLRKYTHDIGSEQP